MDGFVKAGDWWSRRLKNIFMDSYVIADMEGRANGLRPKVDDNLPFRLAEQLKNRGHVPKDAALVGWFFEVQRDGMTLRFMHQSYKEAESNDMICEERIGRL